jgi:segregation and condensation protein B
MAQPDAAKAPHGKGRTGQASAGDEHLLDRELADLPPEMRWREWMLRVEAVIFAWAEPVSRETLARVVGSDCSIDLLIDDLREELRSRPYEIAAVARGRQHRTHLRFARPTSRPTPLVPLTPRCRNQSGV